MDAVEVETRVLGPDDWVLWRDVRLRSLADSPDAFGSTLDLETPYLEDDWRRWLTTPGVVVLADGAPVACGAVFVERPGQAMVVAMWVEPGHRGRGHSRRVLDVLVDWCRERGLRVVIGVNRANPRARAVYEGYGFVATGHTHPLREGSEQVCDELELPATRG